MSAEIVNLRQVRKAKERAAKEARADANRRKHGRTKAERATEDDARKRAERRLDGLELDCRAKSIADEPDSEGR